MVTQEVTLVDIRESALKPVNPSKNDVKIVIKTVTSECTPITKLQENSIISQQLTDL